MQVHPPCQEKVLIIQHCNLKCIHALQTTSCFLLICQVNDFIGFVDSV